MKKVFLIDSLVNVPSDVADSERTSKMTTLFDFKRCQLQRKDVGMLGESLDPNVEIIMVHITPETLAAIKAHPDYGDAAVLSEEEL